VTPVENFPLIQLLTDMPPDPEPLADGNQLILC